MEDGWRKRRLLRALFCHWKRPTVFSLNALSLDALLGYKTPINLDGPGEFLQGQARKWKIDGESEDSRVHSFATGNVQLFSHSLYSLTSFDLDQSLYRIMSADTA